MSASRTTTTAAATPWRGSMPREMAEEWAWLIQDGCSIDEVAHWAGRGKATVWRAIQRVTGQKAAALRQLHCVDCGLQLARVPRQRDGRCAACRARRRQEARLAAHDVCAHCGGRLANHRETDGRPRFCERCGDAPYTRWRVRNDPVYQQFNRDYARWRSFFRHGRATAAERPRLAAYRAAAGTPVERAG